MRTLRTGAVGMIFLALAVGLGLLWRQTRQLKRSVKQMQWEAVVQEHWSSHDLVKLDVGHIQFIRNGFSVTFDSISYEPGGIRLVGRLGNENALNVSSLTLVVEVSHPLGTVRAQYFRAKSRLQFLYDLNLGIGTAQVALPTLNAGSQVIFKTTVPNVHQSQEDYEVRIRFSGERYGYLRLGS